MGFCNTEASSRQSSWHCWAIDGSNYFHVVEALRLLLMTTLWGFVRDVTRYREGVSLQPAIIACCPIRKIG